MKALRPVWLASSLLAGYVLAALWLLAVGADGLGVLILGILLGVPWIVWPAALAARMAATADDPIKSWGSLALEAAVIGSTIWVWIHLTRNPDAQNGLAFVWLPLLQFAGVGAGWLGLLLCQGLLARSQRAAT